MGRSRRNRKEAITTSTMLAGHQSGRQALYPRAPDWFRLGCQWLSRFWCSHVWFQSSNLEWMFVIKFPTLTGVAMVDHSWGGSLPRATRRGSASSSTASHCKEQPCKTWTLACPVWNKPSLRVSCRVLRRTTDQNSNLGRDTEFHVLDR